MRAVLDEQGRPLKSFKVQVEAAASPAAVYQLDRMLMLVPTHGTAREAAAHLPRGLVIAGKTGTSSDTRDSWFAGFTGSYLAVAWVGYDDNRETITGAAGALPVWADTMASFKTRLLRSGHPRDGGGPLDRVRGRTRDDCKLRHGFRRHRCAEGHSAAHQSPLLLCAACRRGRQDNRG